MVSILQRYRAYPKESCLIRSLKLPSHGAFAKRWHRPNGRGNDESTKLHFQADADDANFSQPIADPIACERVCASLCLHRKGPEHSYACACAFMHGYMHAGMEAHDHAKVRAQVYVEARVRPACTPIGLHEESFF